MKGSIFNIQRFSVNDGPGIRTTVFFKGCPLDCAWCHNPESKSSAQEMSFDAKRCADCGRCAAVCPQQCHAFENHRHTFHRERCEQCGACAQACIRGALERVGRTVEAEDVVREVLRDEVFFEASGGGMTVSGGEPMAQPEFLASLIRLAKVRGLNTAIETSGFAAWKHFESILADVDFFLFDVKETNAQRHFEFVRAPLKPIQENLRRLDNSGAAIILRCPLIPNYNVRDDHFEGIAEIANSLKNVLRVELEPYHPLGASKARNIGREYRVESEVFPSHEMSQQWLEQLRGMIRVPVRLA